MHNSVRLALATIAFVAITSCTGASARGRITEVHEIQINPGSNQINMFVEDGRSALITEGWRDLGTGVGYPIYTVMLPSANPARGWDIVPVEPASSTAGEHETTEISGPVRFARGWLDGKPTTFLFTARRDPTESVAKPGYIALDVYRLITARKGDKSENAFIPVITTRSSDRLCSPDLAIAREFGLEERIPPGHKISDGCPARV